MPPSPQNKTIHKTFTHIFTYVKSLASVHSQRRVNRVFVSAKEKCARSCSSRLVESAESLVGFFCWYLLVANIVRFELRTLCNSFFLFCYCKSNCNAKNHDLCRQQQWCPRAASTTTSAHQHLILPPRIMRIQNTACVQNLRESRRFSLNHPRE